MRIGVLARVLEVRYASGHEPIHSPLRAGDLVAIEDRAKNRSTPDDWFVRTGDDRYGHIGAQYLDEQS